MGQMPSRTPTMLLRQCALGDAKRWRYLIETPSFIGRREGRLLCDDARHNRDLITTECMDVVCVRYPAGGFYPIALV